ncbi:DUF1036 domain-containing protein [Litoreibacter janthinus]|uniref:Uncharacterized membrane protein n=1 Tax=Litoreibacter janthinus TaxID=670154 RepID=A0A1I6IE49_9RHOB|nr:DUF1036 domain-containing protein [Litoreibacter janthinus]SFR64963.1 Uncharacterized membrane protein [Litoreibacter janthinus]
MNHTATSLSYVICRAAALAFALVGGMALSPGAARAEFAVCNQSFDVVNVAIGRDVDGDFQTEGWWTIGTNQCANVIREELESRYIYVYAQDVFGKPMLNGTTTMCIEPKRFTIRGISSCWSRGHIQARFIEVDTEKTQRWSLFLTPPN